VKSKLQKAIEVAIARAEESPDIASLPNEIRIVAMIHAAQGIIDNGGLRYFFEMDFPDRPPYSRFVDAYREIGANEEASLLEQAIALFPFEDPHLHVRKRNEFLDSFKNAEGEEVASPFTPLCDRLCGNVNPWQRLASFVERHPSGFSTALSAPTMRIFKAGISYFALVFAAGFALGAIRVPLLVPRLGERVAELVEMPIMLVVILCSARFVVRRFQLPASAAVRWPVGLVAVALLLAAEVLLVVSIQDLALDQYVASRDPVSGTVYLVMLGVLAAMPWLLARVR
jgi:hypothetical protein